MIFVFILGVALGSVATFIAMSMVITAGERNRDSWGSKLARDAKDRED